MDYKFTLFTPVYNGAKTVHRVFDSVRNSTYTNFEWIIINDGSSDNSVYVIHQLMNSVDCNIKFVNFEKNRGKHIAWNHAASLATGDLWITIDCDDSFEPDSLLFLNDKWNEIKADDISGIDVLCYRGTKENVFGSKFPEDRFKSSYLHYTHKHKILNEKWNCVRVDLIKAVKFPEIRANFFLESYLWYHLSDKYSVMCYNKALRNYHYDSSSIINGQTWDYYNLKMKIQYYRWFLTRHLFFLLKYDRNIICKQFFVILKSYVLCVVLRFLRASRIKVVNKWQ